MSYIKQFLVISITIFCTSLVMADCEAGCNCIETSTVFQSLGFAIQDLESRMSALEDRVDAAIPRSRGSELDANDTEGSIEVGE